MRTPKDFCIWLNGFLYGKEYLGKADIEMLVKVLDEQILAEPKNTTTTRAPEPKEENSIKKALEEWEKAQSEKPKYPPYNPPPFMPQIPGPVYGPVICGSPQVAGVDQPIYNREFTVDGDYFVFTKKESA